VKKQHAAGRARRAGGAVRGPRRDQARGAAELLRRLGGLLLRLGDGQAGAEHLGPGERDSQADPGRTAPLTAFSLVLTDLAVAMLDAPGSVPPRIDASAGPAGQE
jgi:hypothetical protein